MNLPISIIIPIYNVEKYLIECLESVRNQTFTDFEVIMVNDGSSDASPVIADNYCQRDKRFKLFHQENQGQSAARNFGLSQAKGEYIFFLDSDDKIVENTLEILHRICQDKQSDIVIAACKYFNNDGDYWMMGSGTPTVNFYDSHAAIRKEEEGDPMLSFTSPCCKLVKTDIVRQNSFPVGRLYEDAATTYRWYMVANKIYYINLNLYAYRQRSGSTMATRGDNLVKHYNDNVINLSHKISDLKSDGYDPLMTLNSYIDKLYFGRLYYEDFDRVAQEIWKKDYKSYFSFKEFFSHALVLTNSDEIEQIETLAKELPNLCFHIAAYTAVSYKLIQLAERVENIFIHPLAQNNLVEDLLAQADIYLDINYYNEVDNIVSRASQKELPILAFEHTVHRFELVEADKIFSADEVEQMTATIKLLIGERTAY
ncbi:MULTISPECIES: glycosyltransferase [Aerococcus]|uniref:glycosyltransferase n=1 Tax=Aerococcus TaxID=1375 RepID=UPI000DCB2451|nr:MULTISPECIES: glycosyltransferase [Aerococcus]KAA9234409.1 glycosyltransferase [Aerococcus mictus]MBU5610252.1 glycosyltransferase [Aerococcus urinae]MDK6291462.1 glycosyltransferase [Aerococcus urinae]MDK6374501.1 glycosyltransferase [Aerococcus urinae]MDK6420260.1 glycosyltransferase [Aerococcus urinae]